MRIEDYGLIGDLQAAALVGRNGSVDWLCLPRFDSSSCFTALLGDETHGRWLVAPSGEVRSTSRRYRPGTLVLETEFETKEGAVRVIDFMPRRGEGPAVEDADSALARTEAWWRDWSGRCTYQGPYRDEVLTSLIALKAMTFETTGAVIAAPTTSLPEDIGGERNWDYRFCWLRDSVLTLEALLQTGYTEEALGFRDFLTRVGTGDPSKIQIMYGIDGGRRLTEFELPELPGYEESRPVRIGNAASEQFQLDVYGEVIGVGFLGAKLTGRIEERFWPRWRAVVEHFEGIWREPDDGIWESRGPRRHYTYSKVMAWVVFERAIRIAEEFELEAPVDRWKLIREEIHDEVCKRGYDPERRTFTQYYGSKELDASVLNIPLVGFLSGTDDRVTGTIDAISRELGRDGFVSRYSTAETDDGLSGDEGQFLACSFWLVSALALNDRVEEARALFERLLGLSNDLGLLAEEYDVKRQRQVGNFPQAFSHLTLVGAATAISAAEHSESA